MRFTIEPIWPWPWIAVAMAALLGLVLWTYPPRIRHLKPWERRTLLGLRVAAILLIGIAMLRPVIHLRSDQKHTVYIYVVADASRSMSTPDGPGGQTRRQSLIKTLEEAAEVLEELGQDFEIRYVDFAGEAAEVEELTDKTDGAETNIAAALKEVLRESDGKRIIGVLLHGDGAPRTVGGSTLDQRSQSREASRALGQQRIPVHTVTYGGSGIAGSAVDLAVEDLQVDPNPFQGKVVSLRANLRVLGAAGRRLTARVLVEDRSGKRLGEAGKMIEASPLKTSTPKENNLSTPENRDVLPVELSFVPTQPGEYKIAVEAVPLDDELKKTNNILETIITVRTGGISVAYFDQVLRPEQKYLRRVNASDKIQLDFYPVRPGGFGPPTKIDAAIFDPGPTAYDVFIIGSVPASVFGDALLKKLAERVNEGAGLMMIGGFDSFGPGGYAGTPIAKQLPVEMTPGEKRLGNEVSPNEHYLEPLQMIPTERGLRHYVMRIDPVGQHRERWEKLAKLEGANKLRAKLGGLVEILARTPQGDPLLLSHTLAPARVMAFGADTTHQWYTNGQQDAHQRFWRQVILYLARKENEGNQPVWVRVESDGRNFVQKDTVPLRFGARKEDGSPLTDVDFEVKVFDPQMNPNDINEKPHDVPPARNGDEFTGTIGKDVTEKPGDYWVRVEAKKNGAHVGYAWARFLVESKDLELDNPAADAGLMEEIAQASGGTAMKPADVKAFLERLRDNYTGVDSPLGLKRITLWDTWPRIGEDGYVPGLLLLFVLIMTAEWFLRKRKGLV